MIDKAKIENFVAQLNNKWPKQFDYFDYEEGKKYWKIILKGKDQRMGCSSYAFIDKTTGDLYKSASWKAPAKHIRGNINDSTGIDACNEYGVIYLR